MIRGLLLKTLDEVWLSTLLFGGALLLVKALLTYIVPQVQEGVNEMVAQLPFVRTLMSALLGIELNEEITARMLQAIVWVHPAVLAVLWAQEIVYCTRMPAGEIDRGTIDVLLGLPVSRRMVYFCDSLMWLCCGVFVLLAGMAGHLLGAQTMDAEMRPAALRMLAVLLNLFGVYVAVGGVAYLASALSSRRGWAVATVFSVVVGSFLLSFLAQFWEPAGQLAFLSVLHYYQPAEILRGGPFPVADLLILFAFGGLAWLIGCEVVARRSICTV